VPRVRGSVHLTSSLVPAAIAVRVLLALDVVANIASLPALLNQRSAMQDFVAGRATLQDIKQADDSASLLSNLSLAAVLLAALAYLVWFFQAPKQC